MPLPDALAALSGAPGVRVVTMGSGQWDSLLAACYDLGWILLEVVDEVPVRAYQKATK